MKNPSSKSTNRQLLDDLIDRGLRNLNSLEAKEDTLVRCKYMTMAINASRQVVLARAQCDE